MNNRIQAGRGPATPFARRFGTLALAALIGLGVLNPTSANSAELLPHTDMSAPQIPATRLVNINYPQMPVPEVKAYLSDNDPMTGYLNVSWEAIPGAEKYQVILFNGAYHSYWDVPATETSWTTKGKGMFPTIDQLLAGEIDFRRNGSGMEFMGDPGPLYERAFAEKGGIDYSETDNYYVRVTAVHEDGARPISSAVKARIPIVDFQQQGENEVIGDMIEGLEIEREGLDDPIEIAAQEDALEYLQTLDESEELTPEEADELYDRLLEGAENDSDVQAFSTQNPHMGKIIYIPYSRSAKIIYHGHVGIGSSAERNFIEANPGDGVRVYTNRIEAWKKDATKHKTKPVLLDIKGASNSKKMAAQAYARKQVGKPYSLVSGPWTNAFYCSELVYRSWWSAGYEIGSLYHGYWSPAGYVTPFNIYSDADTKAVKLP